MDIQPFELSIWQDYIEDGTVKEHKLAVLACDYTTTPIGAYNITLQENINGEKTLKFTMPTRYLDPQDNQFKNNPFNDLMVAERKVKLYLGDVEDIINHQNDEDSEERWTEYLIKKVDKDSANFTMTFECKESYVTELGKNGWAVILDNKKKNSFGTVKQLGERILEDSDWKMDESSTIKEGNAQALFRANFLSGSTIDIEPVLTGKGHQSTVIHPGEDYYYFFYSDLEFVPATEEGKQGVWKLKDPSADKIQILYLGGKDIKTSREFILDDDGTVIDDDFKYNYFGPVDLFNRIEQSTTAGVSSTLVTPKGFSGRKLIDSTQTTVEPIADKYVELYTRKADNEPVYSYLDTVYSTSKILKNYVANGKDFTSAAGWTSRDDKDSSFLFKTITNYSGGTSTGSAIFKNCFVVKKLDAETGWSNWNYNRGPHANGIARIPKKKYIVRFRGRQVYADKDSKSESFFAASPSQKLKFQLFAATSDSTTGELTYIGASAEAISDFSKFTYYASGWDKKGYPNIDTVPVREINPTAGNTYLDENGYYYMLITMNDNINDLADIIYLGISTQVGNSDLCWYMDEIQLFEFVNYDSYDDNGIKTTKILFPEDTPTASVITTRTFYQVKDDEVVYLDSNESLYEPLKNDYESVRSLSVSQSNYFNSITSLAELFQGWASFHIKHYLDGRVKLDSQGKPTKTVLISQFHLHDDMNWGGFKYDVNLKSIKRSIDSNSTVSKLIVKNNNNEHATGGICSILRAEDNPLSTNIVYNFDYYITQGLIDGTQFNAWYYGAEMTNTGWLPKTGAKNKELYEQQQKLAAEMTRYKDAQQKYDEIKESQVSLEKSLAQYKENYDYAQKTFTKSADYRLKYEYQYFSALASIQEYERNLLLYQKQSQEIKNRIDTIYEPKIKSLQEEIKTLNDEMYSRNSRFLQEGTWTDDSYIDDTLYYYDACKVSNQSAYPKLSYTIDVADITDNDFYSFKVGERSYIEDPEFFGYDKIDVKSGQVTVNTLEVPHRKEVVIEEYTHHLDDPSKNTITIKTYKNEFKELFSKLTASVQSLSYQSGGYNRASEIVQPNGEVSIRALEKSLTNNTFNIISAGANDMTFSSTDGLVVKDTDTASNIVRTTSKGIIMSNDGGLTWQTAISADGINTNQLTAGFINAGQINILGGDGDNSFMWDENGINAYCDSNGAADRAYVRFNKYGIYGVNGVSQENEVKVEITDENFDDSKDVTLTTMISVDDSAMEVGEDGFETLSFKATPTGNSFELHYVVESGNGCTATMSITRVIGGGMSSSYQEVPIWTQTQPLGNAKFTGIPYTEEQIRKALVKSGISSSAVLSTGSTTWYDLDNNIITDYAANRIDEEGNISLGGSGPASLYEQQIALFVHNYKPYIQLTITGAASQNITLNFDQVESSAIDNWYVTQDGVELSSTTTLTNESQIPTNLNSLPEIMANSSFALTWKGLRFNDSSGRALLFANAETGDLEVNKITAKEGSIAKWSINENYLGYGGSVGSANSMYLSPLGVDGSITFNGSTITNPWTIAVGTNFFVSADGTLYAKNANVEGNISANSIKIGNLFEARPDSSSSTKGYVKIANFLVDETSIYHPNDGYDYGMPGTVMMCSGTGSSVSIGGSNARSGWCFTAGSRFGVANDGALYAGYEDNYYNVRITNDPNEGYYFNASSKVNGTSFSVSKEGILTCNGANISGTVTAANFQTINANSDGSTFCGWSFYNTAFGTIQERDGSRYMMAFSIDDVGYSGYRCVGIGKVSSDTTILSNWGTDLNFAVYGDGKVFCDAIISGEHNRTNNGIECRGQSFFGDLEKVCASPAVSSDSQMKAVLNELKKYIFGTADTKPSGRFAPCGLITVSVQVTDSTHAIAAATLLNAFGIFKVESNTSSGGYNYTYRGWNS